MEMEPDRIFGSYFKEILARYGKIIKAMWIYGSVVRGESKATSDIDLMIILDDAVMDIELNTILEIRQFAYELGEEFKSLNIHPQRPLTSTDFLDVLVSGEPWIITSLKDAVSIYDPSNFLETVRKLIEREPDKISGTEVLLSRAEYSLFNARKIIVENITTNLFNVLVNSSKMVLSQIDLVPPSISTIDEVLRENFRNEKLIRHQDIEFLKELNEIQKKVKRGKITTIDIKTLSNYIERTKSFLKNMNKLFIKLDLERKEIMINKIYDATFGLCKKILKSKTDKQTLEFFDRKLVKKGLAPEYHLNLLAKIHEMKERRRKKEFLKKLYTSYLYSYLLYTINFKKVFKGC